MKKLWLILILVLAVSFAVQAQEMMFGAKTGIALGSVTNDVEDFGFSSEVDKKFRVGMMFGGMMHMPIGDEMMLMVEAAYLQKGVKFEFEGEELTFKTDFLQIDVLAKYMVADAFGIYAGPAMGFLLSAKEDTPIGEFDLKDYMKSTEFSVSFGGQYMFGENMIADARYNLGLTPMNDDEEDEEDMKSTTIILSVGYLF